MTFAWNVPKTRVIKMIQHLGFQVTLIKADDSKAKAYAVWDTNSKLDLANGASKITGNRKQIYIAPNIAKVPAPGDYLQQGSDQYTIEEVEAYKPTSIVLAYRVVCV